MSSITTAKKEIIDFLWEWAEDHKEWGKLLISKIVLTESSLSLSDRENIFNYFLQSIGLKTGLPVLSVEKPLYAPSNNSIELDSLSQIKGVNKLAENQTINFSKNITIIYGSNGTGKTGYGRILKNLGFSYELRKQILGNIYHASTPQSATIKFKSNGVDNTFLWNGSNTNTELENISVFNNNCVQISLSDSRQLIVSPMGFHLFGLVTTELIELAKLLQSQVTNYPTTLSWADLLNPGTLQQVFIYKLSGTSTEQQLNELALFTDEHQKLLKDKESELKNLNKILIQTEISNLSSQLNELRSLISKLQVAKVVLTDTNWQLFLELEEQILDLEKKSEQGIREIADLEGVAFYETKEFQSFIIAAENYVKVLNKSNYPAVDDLCIYCQQPLDDSARKLLISYRQLLNDKSRENLEALKKRKNDLVQSISALDETLVLHQPSFGLDAEKRAVQPIEIIDYNKNIKIAKARFTNEGNGTGSNHFNHDICINLITEKGILTKEILDLKENDLENIDFLEMNLKKEIAELKDKKLLSDKKEEIKNAILNHKIVSTLNSNSNSFNTKSVSAKTSQARDELVSKNFNQIFEEELKAFRKSDVKIKLNFGTSKGTSLVLQKIGSYQLADILSEGEQKAVALAEFLTELQLDKFKMPVIFDDPVDLQQKNGHLVKLLV